MSDAYGFLGAPGMSFGNNPNNMMNTPAPGQSQGGPPQDPGIMSSQAPAEVQQMVQALQGNAGGSGLVAPPSQAQPPSPLVDAPYGVGQGPQVAPTDPGSMVGSVGSQSQGGLGFAQMQQPGMGQALGNQPLTGEMPNINPALLQPPPGNPYG